MKSATTGTLSGCIVWFILFGILSLCVFTVVMIGGGISATSGLAVRTVAPIVCPENTTTNIRTYATTSTDEFGNRQPSTGYVLQCLDSDGNVVKEDPVAYAFIWMGILAVIGVVIAGLLAFVFAAPAGILIAKLINRMKKPNVAQYIEPR
ncbi:MAG TPA: hypothetical protein DCX53_03810 [Anaerolineae bacterium]|nr:hypothetical protein [Anaerolineae bacterium]